MAEKSKGSYVITLHPNGDSDIEEIKELKLEKAQELVGGLVQVVPRFNKYEGQSCVVLCDEEGKMKGSPLNNRATLEWQRCTGSLQGDYIVGTVVIVTGPASRKWA